MDLLYNFPLWAAISAIFFAQLVKVPLHLILTRKLNFSLITSTGGMPSSHSAGVSALTTSVALDAGLNSTLFAVSAVLSIIVMYDATGVRRQAGEHAAILNRLRIDFQKLIAELNSNEKDNHEEIDKLKELLGHKPLEVFFGCLTGILWALILNYFIGVF